MGQPRIFLARAANSSAPRSTRSLVSPKIAPWPVLQVKFPFLLTLNGKKRGMKGDGTKILIQRSLLSKPAPLNCSSFARQSTPNSPLGSRRQAKQRKAQKGAICSVISNLFVFTIPRKSSETMGEICSRAGSVPFAEDHRQVSEDSARLLLQQGGKGREAANQLSGSSGSSQNPGKVGEISMLIQPLPKPSGTIREYRSSAFTQNNRV